MALTPSQVSEEFEEALTEEILILLFLLRESVDTGILKEAYRVGNPQAVVDSIDWETFKSGLSGITPTLLKAYTEGSKSTLAEQSNTFKGGPIDITGPQSQVFLQAIYDMILELVEATKRGVYSVTEKLQSEGMGTNTAASIIILLLGLTSQSASSLINARNAQIKNGNPLKSVKESLNRQSEKALLTRASFISEDELYSSVSQGRKDTWEQWVATGFLASDKLKQWVTKADEFVCPVCGPLHLVTTAIGTPYPGGLFSTPAHPRCRCYERLFR